MVFQGFAQGFCLCLALLKGLLVMFLYFFLGLKQIQATGYPQKASKQLPRRPPPGEDSIDGASVSPLLGDDLHVRSERVSGQFWSSPVRINIPSSLQHSGFLEFSFLGDLKEVRLLPRTVFISFPVFWLSLSPIGRVRI